MTVITLSGLTKRFDATTAVDSVDLTVNDGELFFLLGPSGCGKTTLLRMIAGFIEPTRGTIRFGAEDVTRLAPNKRNAGMVFQSYALWPHMSAFENVSYGLSVRKIKAQERKARVEAALRSVRMLSCADRKPNQLSGGQQQRVALARALVIQPSVLLLDEPLSNLDAKLRLEMRSEITRLCSETKVTTIYVTHDQKEALSMADRIAVLREGRVVQTGPPRELYERPTSRFVADFLGEANFLAAEVIAVRDGLIELQTPAGRLLSACAAGDVPLGGNVTCSIRPESLQFASSGDSPNKLAGKRRQTIYLGEAAQHLIELDDGTTVKVLEIHPSHFGQAGDRVELVVSSRDVTLLTD